MNLHMRTSSQVSPNITMHVQAETTSFIPRVRLCASIARLARLYAPPPPDTAH